MPRLKTETFGTGDQSWLASTHSIYNCRTGTLNLGSFVAATHYPDGHIRSGTPVGQITASKLYGPFDSAATDGRQNFVGFVYTDQAVVGTANIPAPIFDHGRVNSDRLPIAVNAAGQTSAAGRIAFVTRGA